jgi:prephenate dehydratase
MNRKCRKVRTIPMSPMNHRVVAYAGEAGAFAHRAALVFDPEAVLVGEPTPAEAVRRLLAGEAEAVVLPVENRWAGPVSGTAELLARHSLAVTRDLWLPVQHVLAAPAGSHLEGLRRVLSHVQALTQCAPYLRARGLLAESRATTSAAAREVAETGRPDTAALCSRHAAERWGLVVLADNIMAVHDNRTRFWRLARTGSPSGPYFTALAAATLPGQVRRVADLVWQAGGRLSRVRRLADSRLLIEGRADRSWDLPRDLARDLAWQCRGRYPRLTSPSS